MNYGALGFRIILVVLQEKIRFLGIIQLREKKGYLYKFNSDFQDLLNNCS